VIFSAFYCTSPKALVNRESFFFALKSFHFLFQWAQQDDLILIGKERR